MQPGGKLALLQEEDFTYRFNLKIPGSIGILPVDPLGRIPIDASCFLSLYSLIRNWYLSENR